MHVRAHTHTPHGTHHTQMTDDDDGDDNDNHTKARYGNLHLYYQPCGDRSNLVKLVNSRTVRDPVSKHKAARVLRNDTQG